MADHLLKEACSLGKGHGAMGCAVVGGGGEDIIDEALLRVLQVNSSSGRWM